jgi:hypothetical protein
MKTTYSIIEDLKFDRNPSGSKSLLEGSTVRTNILFKAGDKDHQVSLLHTWFIDGDLKEGLLVDASSWSAKVEGSSESIQALIEQNSNFSKLTKITKDSLRSSEIDDLVYDIETFLEAEGAIKTA